MALILLASAYADPLPDADPQPDADPEPNAEPQQNYGSPVISSNPMAISSMSSPSHNHGIADHGSHGNSHGIADSGYPGTR